MSRSNLATIGHLLLCYGALALEAAFSFGVMTFVVLSYANGPSMNEQLVLFFWLATPLFCLGMAFAVTVAYALGQKYLFLWCVPPAPVAVASFIAAVVYRVAAT